MPRITRSTLELTEHQKNLVRIWRTRAMSDKFGQPYLAPAFLRMIPVSAPGLQTMAVTDDWHWYIDFEYCEERGQEWSTGVTNHEVWHLLRKHGFRFMNLKTGQWQPSAEVWNWAADMEINDNIEDRIPKDGWIPGRGALTAYKPHDTAENYYKQLCNDPNFVRKNDEGQQNQQGDQGQGQPGQGQPGQGQPGQGQPGQGQPGQGQPGQGQPGQGQPGQGQPGQGQPGQGQPCQGQPGQGQQGQNDDAPQARDDVHGPDCGTAAGNGENLKDYLLDEAEAAKNAVDEIEESLLISEIAERIKRGAQMIGKTPGGQGVVQWAEDVTTEKPVDWRKELRATMNLTIANNKRGRADYTRRRPARRQPVPGVLFAGMVEPDIKLLAGIDTSGSNLGNLPLVLSEAKRIAKQTGVRGRDFRTFAVDVKAGKAKAVNNPTKILEHVSIGGGTRMRAAFDYAAEQKREDRPNVFLLLTDGEVTPDDFPSEQPNGLHGISCITAIILTGRPNDSRNKHTVDNAERTLAKWSKVIYLYNVED